MKRTVLAVCALFTQPNPALAAMYVYPMKVSVPLKGASQIKLISQDDETKFIKVTLKQVLQPGTPQETEKEVDASKTPALLITPQKIALSSGSERLVRLISVTPPQKETTWRAYFESVNQDNFIVQPQEQQNSSSTASLGVNVVWGALIHVEPEKTLPGLKLTDGTGKVSNDGTIRIPIKEFGDCDRAGQCQWKKMSSTVYPDTEISLPGVTFSPDKQYRIKYENWITQKTEEMSLSR